MSRTLILLRHGKSDWSTGDDDFNRPLKKRGKGKIDQFDLGGLLAPGIAEWQTQGHQQHCKLTE